MKKILISLSVIGIVAAAIVGVTTAYYSDIETSTGNTLQAGSIDLKIDLQCPEIGCDFSLRDLVGQSFFQECDVKPGDTGEVTISWHVYDNDAYARIKVTDLHDYENGCTDPESDVDTTCGDPGDGEGELTENLALTIWMDEGETVGWQCPDLQNGPCCEDPLEGDNILNGVEVTVVESKPISEIIADGGVPLPGVMDGSTTYYTGLQWELPFAAGNDVQSDSLVGKIVMEVVQSRNNPNPWAVPAP